MAHRWKNTGYTVNRHEVLRLYAVYDGGLVEELPLNRFKCKNCSRRATSLPEFEDKRECPYSEDSWIGKIRKLFRKP